MYTFQLYLMLFVATKNTAFVLVTDCGRKCTILLLVKVTIISFVAHQYDKALSKSCNSVYYDANNTMPLVNIIEQL